MKFHRVYVEITNICGLKCTFCPPKILPTQTMSLALFEKILEELKPYTKELAFHVVGDPLVLSNLDQYLDYAHKLGFMVALTTSGYYLSKQPQDRLIHPAIKQINISLNSYNKNSMPISLEEYLSPIFGLCKAKPSSMFINLRVWNLDEKMSEKSFNEKLFSYIEKNFNIILDIENTKKPKPIRLSEKIRLHFDSYFEWPSLTCDNLSDGRCEGLKSHFAILASGKVVPCCLDKDGVIELGDLNSTPLKTILQSPRSIAIRDGFKKGIATEILCKKCLYKERFKEI